MNLNPKEIKEKYPKSVEKLKEYLSKGYKDVNIPKELEAQIDPEKLAHLTIFGVRGLYEFFDENDLIIDIIYWGEGSGFGYTIYGADSSSRKVKFSKRLEAEKDAFETAFENLENILNHDKK